MSSFKNLFYEYENIQAKNKAEILGYGSVTEQVVKVIKAFRFPSISLSTFAEGWMGKIRKQS
jgi:urate oxidase